jgi:hypothetical protein
VKRVVCRLLSAATLTLTFFPLASLLGGARAEALAPTATGYWVKLGAAVPTVPSGGLFVANDPTASVNPAQPSLPVPVPVPIPNPPSLPLPSLAGPTAISAVRITGIDPTKDATLSLKVAPGSAVPPPTVTTIVACPIVTAWQPPSGAGNISKAPLYDCSARSTGRVAAGLDAISWLLPSSYQPTPGELDVALIPSTGALPIPFAVAFQHPDANSVRASTGAEIVPTAPPAAAATPNPTVPASSSSPGPVPAFTPPAAPALPVVTQPQVAATASRGNGGFGPTLLAGVRLPGDDRAHRIMAVVLLIAVAGGWWWVGGQPVRRPRLLGALGGDADHAQTSDSAGQLGGVGRFSRSRTSSPRRL